MKVFIASGNAGKVAEIVPLVEEFLPQVLGETAAQIIPRAALSADETENTFIGNARIKANALVAELVAEISIENFPLAVLADDSGLEVAALGGQPGVHSARYAGDHVDSAAHMTKVLHELSLVESTDRSCAYICALTLKICFSPTHIETYEGEGRCAGSITESTGGSGGFGYDPICWIPALSKRMSEATIAEKNSLSHRRRAFEQLAQALKLAQS